MAMLRNTINGHELIFVDEDNGVIEEYNCSVCNTAIQQGSPTYICSITDCELCIKCIDGKLRLHKKCGELPTKIKHPMHQHSLLKLHFGLTLNPCNVCWRKKLVSYHYTCCDLIFCIECALMEPVLVHQGHENSLTLFYRQTLSRCDACGTEAKDFCYLCVLCQFLIHRTCLSYPHTLKLRIHLHDLKLIYSLPGIYRVHRKHCDVCKKEVIRQFWVYFCRSCGYCVHLKCAIGVLAAETSATETQEVVEDEEKISDMVQFPLLRPDMVLDLVSEYHSREKATIQEIKEEEDDDDDDKNKDCIIWHWSHKEHPLFLLEEFKEDSNGIEINDDEMLVCNGCVQPISPSSNKSYYGCIGCGYFLHKICAKNLPSELPTGRCPYNPQHSLKLCNFSSFLAIFPCSLCMLNTNGFVYGCKECGVSFCICCCYRPFKIKHDCHKHPLVLRISSSKSCNGCLYKIYSQFEYGCETCEDIQIHVSCNAWWYPKTISHRWDNHKIPLMYPPIYYEGLRYCEKCEQEVNPETWLYRCLESDQTFHLKCLRPDKNVKVGHTINVPDHHPHALTFVAKPQMNHGYLFSYMESHPHLFCRGRTNCNEFGFIRHYLECARCEYLICTDCSSGWLPRVTQQPSLNNLLKHFLKRSLP